MTQGFRRMTIKLPPSEQVEPINPTSAEAVSSDPVASTYTEENFDLDEADKQLQAVLEDATLLPLMSLWLPTNKSRGGTPTLQLDQRWWRRIWTLYETFSIKPG